MKKIGALFLALLVSIPNVVQANGMDKELTQTILEVKKQIIVPQEFSEFEYSLIGKEEQKKYRFTWHDEEYEIGTMQIVAENGGKITDYSKVLYDKQHEVLAEKTYEEGLKEATLFLEHIAPSYVKGLKLVKNSRDLEGDAYNYTFDYYVNGVKVFGHQVVVRVNKRSGEVIDFSGLPTYIGFTLTNEPKISLEEAKKIYNKEIGVKLVYSLHYDYKNKMITSIPVYKVNNIGNKVIDGITGEILVPYRENSYEGVGYKASSKDEALTASTNSSLTLSESKKVKETAGLLSKEKALNHAAKNFPKLSGVSLVNSSLRKNSYTNQYIWSLSGKVNEDENIGTVDVVVDASSGEVLSYYYPQEVLREELNEKVKKVDEKVVKQKIESFLRKIVPDRYPTLKCTEQTEREIKDREQTYYYERIVNGIPVEGNGVSITYDTIQDEVIRYNCDWSNLEFKPLTHKINAQDVIDQIGLELMYVDKDEKTRVIAYSHEKNYRLFDPFTGKEIQRDGTTLRKEQTEFYNDVKGHKREAIIKKLYDSGLGLKGDSFRPDEGILQIDLLRLILKCTDLNYSAEEIYNRAVEREILDKAEIDENKILTKEQGVAYIINGLGYRKIAELTEIYKLPIDEEVNSKLRGHIALAYGLGLIKKDDFVSQDPLTRAEAAEKIYNMLLIEGK